MRVVRPSASVSSACWILDSVTLSSAEAMLTETVSNYSVKVAVVSKIVIFVIVCYLLLYKSAVAVVKTSGVKLVAKCSPHCNVTLHVKARAGTEGNVSTHCRCRITEGSAELN